MAIDPLLFALLALLPLSHGVAAAPKAVAALSRRRRLVAARPAERGINRPGSARATNGAAAIASRWGG